MEETAKVNLTKRRHGRMAEKAAKGAVSFTINILLTNTAHFTYAH
jgi:hypothetical protein